MATKTGEVNYLQKGEQGDIGPLVYPAGEYASGVTYTRTALSAPMVLCEGQYYVLSKAGSFKGINPKTDYAANGSKATWVLMDKVQYAFFEVVMANFAKFASAVFYQQYMFSQQGVDASGKSTTNYKGFSSNAFTPNIQLDFLTGAVHFAQKNFVCDAVGNVFLKGTIMTPYKRLTVTAEGAGFLLDLSFWGYRIDISNLTSIIGARNTIILPPASEHIGAECRLIYPHLCTRAPHEHPIISTYPGEYFSNLPNTSTASEIELVENKVVKISSVNQMNSNGATISAQWYIENPEDVKIVS